MTCGPRLEVLALKLTVVPRPDRSMRVLYRCTWNLPAYDPHYLMNWVAQAAVPHLCASGDGEGEELGGDGLEGQKERIEGDDWRLMLEAHDDCGAALRTWPGREL